MRIRASFVATAALLGLVSGLGTVRAQEGASTLRLDLGSGVSIDLVLVKAGTFTQGSPATETGRAEDETTREVRLTRDFYIGTHEVTVGQFERFAAESGYKTEAEKGTSGGFGWNGKILEQRPAFNWKNPGFVQTAGHPVTIVTFNDALAFTQWLSRKSGRTVSLPTEAQWEFAARANSTSAYPSGAARATQPADLGWSKANAGEGAHPVGKKAPNGIGLFDMAGNVAEWCLDWYGPYDPSALQDPLETNQDRSDKPRRVLRGGSWLRDPKNGRSAARHRNDPKTRNADNGFRIVASTKAGTVQAGPAGSTTAPARGVKDESTGTSDGAIILGSIFVAGLVGLFVLWRIMVRLFLGKTAASVDTRITPDGFTIKAPKVPLGHRMHYRYQMDGEWKEGSVVYSGDSGMEQTIYTGSRPTSAIVYAVTAPGEKLPVEKAKPAARPTEDPVTRRNDDDSFRGYPSAYR